MHVTCVTKKDGIKPNVNSSFICSTCELNQVKEVRMDNGPKEKTDDTLMDNINDIAKSLLTLNVVEVVESR